MIRSMTGYGRGTFSAGEAQYDIDVRSVNHRYLDARVRLPRLLASQEVPVRERIAAVYARGKVDLSVNSPEGSGPRPELHIDDEAARAYVAAARSLVSDEGVGGQLDVGTLLALPGVARFREPELSEEALAAALLEGIDRALAEADGMRLAEGASLESDLLGRICCIYRVHRQVETTDRNVSAATAHTLQQPDF